MLINKNQMDDIFEKYGIKINQEEYNKFYKYSELLIEWNKKINLTAITTPEDIAIKHFFDSVYPFTLFKLPENSTIIDVGTGAGFPSCPLKIFREDVQITLLDSLQKRVYFLLQLSQNLKLNAKCVHGRAEELGKKTEYREKYDCACIRAVGNLSQISEYCIPFVKVGGIFVALKGSSGKEELVQASEAMKILGGELEDFFEYTLPNGDGRSLILIRKIKETPPNYPRKMGQIKKKLL